jgi:hypothetical protein
MSAPFSSVRPLAEEPHALGPRLLTEFLLEVAAGADLWDCLEEYCRLDRPIELAVLP